MTAIGLGMPTAPPPVLAPRRKTRQIQVGKVGVGSDHQISVQSMTTTLTADVNSTLQQIAELTASGCQIVTIGQYLRPSLANVPMSRYYTPSDRGFGFTALAPMIWANATHVCTCEVDVTTGAVRLLRYIVSEDCGPMINPNVVEGQIAGGTVQGIGGALYEHLAYDADGNPLWRCSGTLISAKVFLTAGHCTEAPAARAQIWFQSDVESGIPGNGYPFKGQVGGTVVDKAGKPTIAAVGITMDTVKPVKIGDEVPLVEYAKAIVAELRGHQIRAAGDYGDRACRAKVHEHRALLAVLHLALERRMSASAVDQAADGLAVALTHYQHWKYQSLSDT